jgi:hypothetical protein
MEHKRNPNYGKMKCFPCHITNRFTCPYEYVKGNVSDKKIDVEDLFELANVAFAVELALAI